ncbi:MAG TPA: helix-turn-helix domain-containing protein [Ferrovibrio sp.]|uniref:helix-turn-helix domain-containing protein n=1 Tax=Ferrovibrio sp. TaxID=1917215 RepID=UPI002B4B7725|nr:helix-turn-helix domain-containing protein [Ferrovibrio sp.]HLT75796.1 helix-turn-helix domain-containing protein [Ferrovibrio sp.]
MAQVPVYALYGEDDTEIAPNWLHCESIPARSALFDWEIGLHRHRQFFQILNITGGQATCFLDGREIRLAPPAALTVPPGVPHGFRFSPDIQGHVITLQAGQLDVILRSSPEARRLFGTPRAMRISDPAGAARLAGSVAAIAAEFPGSAPGRAGLIEAHLAILLIELSRLVAAERGEADAAFRPMERHAAAFRVLLDREFRRQRSVGFYAAQLGISEMHLNRVCRAAFGTSALGAINRRIMLEASRDLTFTVLSVKEIAYSLGFEDPAYFTRFFTRHAGETPTAFRRRNAA